MLSRQHSAEMTNTQNRKCSKEKPHFSNQMVTYSTPLRRTINWYQRLAINLLLNTSIVYLIVLFKQVTRRNIAISDFIMELAMYLLKYSDNDCISQKNHLHTRPHHKFKKCREMQEI